MRLADVGKRYGPRGAWVLRGVRLDLPAGAILRVDGPNGSGKSTLLKIVAGVCVPTTGRVRGRRRRAYVPDRFPASLPFTARGYLTHLGRIHGLSTRESTRRADRWLDRFDATAHATRALRELSKGSAQKVAVVQALMAEADLLVLDEAWTGLDGDARLVLDEAVCERVGAGGTVIFADHDPTRLAGRLTSAHRIEDGTLSHVGTVPLVGTLSHVGTVAGPGHPEMVIEVANVRVDQLAELAVTGAVEARGRGGNLVRLRTATRDSDALLRQLLTAHPAAHVVRVWPETSPEPPGAAAAEVDS